MLSVEQLQSEIQRALGPNILQMSVELGELSVLVARTRIVDVLRTLRDDPAIAMSQLMDICGADYPERPERFEVVYNLLSLRHNARVRVKLHTDETTPVPTVVSLYTAPPDGSNAKAGIMFGVRFLRQPRSAPHPVPITVSKAIRCARISR